MQKGQMVGKLFLAALALAMTATATDASAEIATESPEVFLPNSAPRGDVVVQEGDLVLRLPILWASAARTGAPATLVAEGKTKELAAGTLLQAVELSSPVGPSRTKIGFCTPERHGERALEHGVGAILFGGGMLTRQIAHNAESGQFCLFDSDGAGYFNEVSYFHSGLLDGTLPEKLRPVAFNKLNMVPVSSSGQDEIRISASHVGRHSLELKLDIIQAGQARVFTTISTAGILTKRYTTIDIDQPLPQSFNILGTDLKVVEFDHSRKSVTIRFPEDSDKTRIMIIPENTQIHYCFGYICPSS